ncbi:MAG: PIN domain-containing protein [Acidimicrobiales bacterium]
MRRLLLDTTFLIDADRGGDTLDDVIGDDDDVAVASITIAELRVGVLLAEGKHRSDRLAFVDDVLATIPVVDYDLSVAAAHAQLLIEVRRRGRPRGAHDLIIAATAGASSRTVLTADQSAFDDLTGVNAEPHR